MKIPLSQNQAALILNALSGVGPVSFGKIYGHFGSDLVAALSASEKELKVVPELSKNIAEKVFNWKTLFDLEKEEAKMSKIGAVFLPFFDEKFPKMLKEIPNPPIGIYVLGNVEALQTRRTISIVGTRKASLYGSTQARKIGTDLALAKWTVVSGLARGIDTAAHVGTLDGNGVAIAVLGCGIDIIYPPENEDLSKKIRETGGAIISEFSIGKVADRRTFPQRNRIIAGLGAGMLVVESDEQGGSMISANFAAELGRTVFALPGRIDQENSRGCHKLIREGATLITSANDIIEEMESVSSQPSLALEFGNENGVLSVKESENSEARERRNSSKNSDETAREVLATLPAEAATIFAEFSGSETVSPDEICERTKLAAGTVSSNLLLLELSALIARRADGTYERVF